MFGEGNYGEREYPLLRYQTWMRSHERMAMITLIMSAVTALSVVVASYALLKQPEPIYFAARQDGGILPLVPVSSPYLSDGEVTNFAVQAVTRALTFDFANWRSSLTDAAAYFERPGGWNDFLDALDSSGMLAYIREHRLVSTVVANGAAIIDSGLDSRRRFSWTVQIPLNITYESASELSRDQRLAELVVSRLPTWEAPEAVGITRIIVRPGTGDGQ